MKTPNYLLENWLFGLLNNEERKFSLIKELINQLVESGAVKLNTSLTDYKNGDIYELELKLIKTSIGAEFYNISPNSDLKKAPGESEIYKLLTNSIKCKYNGKCDYKDEGGS